MLQHKKVNVEYQYLYKVSNALTESQHRLLITCPAAIQWILRALTFLWCLFKTSDIFTKHCSLGLFLITRYFRLNKYVGTYSGSQV